MNIVTNKRKKIHKEIKIIHTYIIKKKKHINKIN